MGIQNWVQCPESSCDNSNVQIDTVMQGCDTVLIGFKCMNCEYGSLEDDLPYWVECPKCADSDTNVSGYITAQGKIRFECNGCGYKSPEQYPETKWD